MSVDIVWDDFSPETLLDEALRKGYSPIISQCQTRSQSVNLMSAGCSANLQSYLFYYILKKYFSHLLFFPKIRFLFLFAPSRKVHEAHSPLKGYIETRQTQGISSIEDFLGRAQGEVRAAVRAAHPRDDQRHGDGQPV